MIKEKAQLHSITSNVKRAKSYNQTEEFKTIEPDLYLILSDKIYPLHRRFMKHSTYIAKKMAANENVVIIEFEINVSDFQKILKFLYTNEFQVQGTKQIQKFIKLAKILQIDSLQQQIYDNFQTNFEEYSIFELYTIAYTYNIEELKQKCDQYLLQLEYQQMNIYTYDLLEVPIQIFQHIIRNHQKLKANKTICGLGNNQIIAIIQKYCQINKCQININQLLKEEHDCFSVDQIMKSSLQGEQFSDSSRNKKGKTQSVKISYSQLNLQNKFKIPYKSQPLLLMNNKKIQIQQIKQSNQEMQKNNEKRIEQLRQIRDAIIDVDTIDSPLVDILDMEQKIKQFGKICEDQDEKFMQIDKDMNFGEISEKASEQQQQSGQYQSNKNNSKQIITQLSRNCKNQICHKKTAASEHFFKDQLIVNTKKIPQLNKHFYF